MKPMMYYVCLLFFLSQVTACTAGSRHKPAQEDELAQDSVPAGSAVFKLPEMPITITSPRERLSYFVKHYWSNYDFTDTAAIRKPEFTEQALVNYISLLNEVSPEESSECLKQLVRDAEQDEVVHGWFDEKLEHYLYDPNSPLKSDKFYMAVLEEKIISKKYGGVFAERPRYRLGMLKKNCEGMQAADFSFVTESGKRSRLKRVASKYTLLFLYDPECENCGKSIELLHESVALADKCRSFAGSIPLLTVLSVSVEGGKESWLRHLPALPASWTNGYDDREAIRNQELYDLRSVPSLYLLDKDKKVILKNVDAPEALGYINGIN